MINRAVVAECLLSMQPQLKDIVSKRRVYHLQSRGASGAEQVRTIIPDVPGFQFL